MTKNKILTTSKSIAKWLDQQGIRNYHIRQDLSVDVRGDVDLGEKKLTFFPVNFGTIEGSFNVSLNQLTSLKGAPKAVHGSFYCGFNRLVNLEGCPETVTGTFGCWNNRLESLEFCPKFVGDSFNASDNPLLGKAQTCYHFERILKIHQDYVNIKNEKDALQEAIGAKPNLSNKTVKI